MLALVKKPDRPRCPSSRIVVQAAKDRLKRAGHLVGNSVSCEFRQGSLVLHGRLLTYYQKQIAQEAVRGLDGVQQVVNDIEVVAQLRMSEEAE